MSSPVDRQTLIKYLSLVSEMTQLRLTLALEALNEQIDYTSKYLKDRNVVSESFRPSEINFFCYYHRLEKPTLEKSYKEGIRVDPTRSSYEDPNPTGSYRDYTPEEDVISGSATEFDRKLACYTVLMTRLVSQLEEADRCIQELLNAHKYPSRDPDFCIERFTADKIREVIDYHFEFGYIMGDGEFGELQGEVLRQFLDLLNGQTYQRGQGHQFAKNCVLIHRVDAVKFLAVREVNDSLRDWADCSKVLLQNLIDEFGADVCGHMPPKWIHTISIYEDQKLAAAEEASKAAASEDAPADAADATAENAENAMDTE